MFRVNTRYLILLETWHGNSETSLTKVKAKASSLLAACLKVVVAAAAIVSYFQFIANTNKVLDSPRHVLEIATTTTSTLCHMDPHTTAGKTLPIFYNPKKTDTNQHIQPT